MILQTHKPAFPLSKFIENLIYYEGLSIAHNLDRFLPDGNTEIIIDMTENSQHIYDNETFQEIQTCRHAWVSGVRTRPITIPSGRGSRMLIIAFQKGKSFPFYPFPMSDLTDTVAEADLVFGRDIHHLRDQLLTAKSINEMFQHAEDFLLRQGGDGLDDTVATRCIDHALWSMIHTPTARCLQRLSEQIGYSQKHFIDLFRRQIGVSPKQYLKIMRFQNALRVIEAGELLQWNEIALKSGYYDQAHCIHDFKRFAGLTPGEYRSRKTASLNYIPVG